jgi:hypothetical protein
MGQLLGVFSSKKACDIFLDIESKPSFRSLCFCRRWDWNCMLFLGFARSDGGMFAAIGG